MRASGASLFLLVISLTLLIVPAREATTGRSAAASQAGVEQPAPVSSEVSSGELVFQRGILNVEVENPTSLAFGPDGRLYVASLSQIVALTLALPRLEVLSTEVIASGLDAVLGLAFDPAVPAPGVLYASRQEPSATDGFQGVVSRFIGPSWAREDVITGLPTSAPNFNHMTNGLAFDDQGRLFIAQGSSTEAGIWEGTDRWPETPLSAAILVAEIHAPGFDGAITYDPAGPPLDDAVDQTGGDVLVFAAGTRNPYDLVIHSNGNIYATDNGKGVSTVSASCATDGSDPSVADELNLIEEGSYYGQPNRNRGRDDARQCTYHAPEEGSGVDFTGPLAVLPDHCSCDGIVEYTGVGPMRGDLIYVEWTRGNVTRAELSGDGRAVLSTAVLASDFSGPLDVIVDPSGTIFIAEFGGAQVSYLAPDSDRDGCLDRQELGDDESLGGRRDPESFWDFFDPNLDGSVSILDFFELLQRFGAVGDAAIDPLSAPPPPPAYHPRFDRGPSVGPNVWNLGPPDGAIATGDFFGLLAQFGHTCA
ncbi:MAG: PQQ-dependent sugar dehydrogenase [Chloroflexi bacterium]|nr:PQQ-dependent sugar dehydrogenase [Chloroflexota bacterium]